MKLGDAEKIADEVIDYLLPYLNRAEIAGSIRRRKEEVKDIEIVVEPLIENTFNLFGDVTGQHSMLNNRTVLEELGTIEKFGERYVQVALTQGINLDLFIVSPPADWAVIYTIRTGPADFSKWIVTPRSKGGALPNGYRVHQGAVWTSLMTVKVEFREKEEKFLEWLELGWIEPSEREAKWGMFPRTYR